MQRAAVSELKASLSEYLGKVKAGEEILVTDRGVPVAKLVSLRRETPSTGRLQALEKAGIVKIGSGAIPESFWQEPHPCDAQATARAVLAEERDTGR